MAAPTRLTRLQLKSRDKHAQPLLEAIYVDIQKLWIRSKHYAEAFTSNVYHNPFLRWGMWPTIKNQRYWKSVNMLGRDLPAMLAHSAVFSFALESVEDEIFDFLLLLIQANSSSLRMFIVTRNIPYLKNYRDSPLLTAVGPLNASLAIYPEASHPHELYLDFADEIQVCYFKHRAMINADKCLYNQSNFKWSKVRDQLPGWPKEWPYPFDPSTPRRSVLPFEVEDPNTPHLLSDCCQRRGTQCICNIEILERNTIVEVTEFPSFPSPISPLTPALKPSHSNRGVRILRAVRKGTVLGEYTGDYVPYNSARFFRDEAFAHSLRGPIYHERLEEEENKSYDSDETEDDEERAEEKRQQEFTCDILAGRRGNWTRFVNETKVEKEMNVRFEQMVYCRKLRIMCVAIRDVVFGEELLTSYGETYWEDKRGTEW